MDLIKSIFQTAKSKSRKWNLIKTLIQTTFFWILFLYLIPKGIVRFDRFFDIPVFNPMPLTGGVLFTFFGIIGLSSGVTMSWIGRGTPLPLDCPNRLVIKGPYKFVRNPMAVAGIGQGISVGIILGSFTVIAYALTGALLWHFTVKPFEEDDLEQRFGQSFLEYKKNVKCWIPRF